MKYRDLRDFVAGLERQSLLHRIASPVSPVLEMTALADQVLRKSGPALLFEDAIGYNIPVLANLFGTPQRVAMGMGASGIEQLRDIGRVLASLKEPEPPKGFKDAGRLLHMMKSLWDMKPATVRHAPCQEQLFDGAEVDLGRLPVQTCWPDDVGPLITWGLVVTRGPQGGATARRRQNLGIYRQQVIARNQVIMRWLAHRGGALDFRDFALAKPGQPFPIVVALGADPATILGAVTPVPDSLSEYQFAGLLRGSRTEVVDTAAGDAGVMLQVPASAEIVLEGHIPTAEKGFVGRSEHGIALKEQGGYLHALEGPFGDHTGYYNEQDWFPVFEVTRLTQRREPIYHSTYTGKPPDEPAVLGVALNEVFVPILQKQFPEIVDFYLPPEGCSYRMAIISIKKAYPGHAKRVMFGLWSFLRQFMYTKFIVVTDADVDIRNWQDVVWAITTRMDPVRDTTLVEQTPIDYLDFASPVSGLGGKMGLDATHKWPGETSREWGRVITMDAAVTLKVQGLLDEVMAAAAPGQVPPVSDLLVKLYELPPMPVTPPGVMVRKPIGPEHHLLVDWIAAAFSPGWASEAQTALGNRPVSLFVAVQASAPVGFACYDATARGYFGPIGVLPAARGQRLGASLLQACLADMVGVGYGYAVIGGAGPADFFRRAVGAVEIPGSSPGLYRGLLKAGSATVRQEPSG